MSLAYPMDALVSFHYFGDDKLMGEVAGSGRLRLIGDSGAYSALTKGAVIDIGAYADWVTRWRGKLCWAAALDVINDPAASHRNWSTLRNRYGVETVPSLHAGAHLSWLDAYASEGVDLIGVGGLARKGQAIRSLRWTLSLFRVARDRYPNVRFHLWGVLFRRLLGNLPAWSVDSTGTVCQAQRFGWLRAFDPDTGTRHQVNIRDRAGVRRLAPLMMRTVGVDPRALDPMRPTGEPWILMEAAVTQQYALWLQRRHAVAAPLMADEGAGPVGTRVHIAAGPETLRMLVRQPPLHDGA